MRKKKEKKSRLLRTSYRKTIAAPNPKAAAKAANIAQARTQPSSDPEQALEARLQQLGKPDLTAPRKPARPEILARPLKKIVVGATMDTTPDKRASKGKEAKKRVWKQVFLTIRTDFDLINIEEDPITEGQGRHLHDEDGTIVTRKDVVVVSEYQSHEAREEAAKVLTESHGVAKNRAVPEWRNQVPGVEEKAQVMGVEHYNLDQEGTFTYETDSTVAETDDDQDDQPNFKGEPQDETARQTLKKLGGIKGARRA
ncbi:hypothetical protein MMC22_001774 [Lobaria immixta]|nr:hypothetical protein [Lobaria immixta]